MVAGLAGYLISLPSNRDRFHMDTPYYKSQWALNIKSRIIELAQEAQALPGRKRDILIAWNGAPTCRPDPQKRADILDPGNTTFVCTYLPLQYLQEYINYISSI